MLSNEFSSILIENISINRDARMRRTVKEDAILELAHSISQRGLIHPIVLSRDNVLVAGETRLSACKTLGWTHIPFQYADTLEEGDLLLIEIEENVKRRDVDWRDKCVSLEKLHSIHKESNPKWGQSDTAKEIGYTQSMVSEMLQVATALSKGNAMVSAAPKYSTARGIVARAKQREAADTESLISIDIAQIEKSQSEEILIEDFNSWAPHYDGAPFNFLHMDPPYGIGHDKSHFGSARRDGGYADTEDIFWEILSTLCANRDRLLGTSAHLMIWFSMDFYQRTLEKLQEFFWVEPFPLIWFKSDNTGTFPDYTRRPRRVYETAFWCSHGDRKIIQTVGNTFPAPAEQIVGHTSEKNVSMLKHFFRMTVDQTTRMLDPTCGSGSALRAAKSMGASVLGLEINPEFAADAIKALQQ